MTRNKVENSSMFESVGYDADAYVLEVEFKGGGIYRYAGFSLKDWLDFCDAPSKGKHFGQHIRGKFAHERIEEREMHKHTCQQCDAILAEECDCDQPKRMEWCSAKCRKAFDL